MKSSKATLIVLLVFSYQWSLAQIGRDPNIDVNSSFPDTIPTTTADSNYIVPDTTILDYFYIHNIRKTYPYGDTSILGSFGQVDFTRRGNIDYLTLGNPGSAAFPVYHQISEKRGFDHGLHQYNPYRTERDSIRFFEQNRPFTHAYFSPGSSQQNFLVEAIFSRNFSKGVSAIVDYYRINQEGIYTDQKTRHTKFSVGLRYQSKGKRFNSFFTYLSNAMTEENNGGVADESLLNQSGFSIRLAIPVLLSDAFTRHETREFAFNNILKINKLSQTNEYFIRHEFVYEDAKYKYFDETTSSSNDVAFYDTLLADTRGLRFYLRDQKVENGFYISSKWKKLGDVRLGLVHSVHALNRDVDKVTLNNLFAQFESNVKIGKSLTLESMAYMGLFDHRGDLGIKGRLTWDTSPGNMFVQAHFKRNKPNYIEEQLFVNEQLIYNNNFERPVALDLSAGIHLRKTKTSIKLSQLTINKAIYFDENALPTQLNDLYSNTRISISQNIKWGILNLDNQLFYQLFSENIYHRPEYFTKHDLYLNSYLFRKKLFFKFGVDIRLLNEFTAPSYMPLHGQFYQQDDVIRGFYPEADVYFNFKVDSFRAFFRMNNITGYFYDNIAFRVDTYPLFDPNFRLGIAWKMKD